MGERRSAISDDDIDLALAEFGNDPRATIAALLHDIAVLAADQEATEPNVSCGFLRRRQPEPPKRSYVVTTIEHKIAGGPP